MTPLEALKRIKQETAPCTYNHDFDKNKCLDTIETALKRLENYEKNEDFYKDVLNYAYLSEEEKIKKLKALEIIKEKRVEVNILEDCKTCKEYNDFIKHRVWFQEEYTITKEEYDLLKEVLNEKVSI